MHLRSTAARSLVAVPTAAALMLLAPAAHAVSGGKGGAPGNNGTVKIHDAATGQEDVRNEPKVCTFYLDSFGFDANQDVIWAIATVGPKGETLAAWGDLPVDPHGHVRTEDIHLPDGHYKLYWQSVELVDGKLPKEPDLNNPKHKVFKVDCGGQSPAPTGKPSATVPPTPVKTPSASPTSVPSHSPSAPATPPATTPATTPATPPATTPATTPASPSASTQPTETPKPPVPPTTTPTSPAATAPATTPATTPATEEPTIAPSGAPSPAPSGAPTATVPVHVPATETPVNPEQPLIMPDKVSVPTPIPGAADGKKLATTGSDGTLLYAGAGTVLLLGGAGAVVYTRRRRTES
ncbi:LPXTG cell wall anchor domain-containing protein [Kitasatospora sp. NPDC093102]|uniref:LPXTG cell wall anchor domain-containing protein n=1 Tax=Kitasatospora sp. NPDC093102 TaxID=3155069 RepID=UPI003418729E